MTDLRRHCGLARISGRDSSGARFDAMPFGAHHEGFSEFSASAVCIAPGVFLTSATLLWPFFNHDGSQLSEDVGLSVVSPSVASASSTSDSPYAVSPARLLCFLELSQADAAAAALVRSDRPSWHLGWSLQQLRAQEELKTRLLTGPIAERRRFVPLGLVAVLRVAADSAAGHCVPVRWPSEGSPPPQVGVDVTVVASPYGVTAPLLFLNSLSRGVVANRVGSEGLLLLDARTFPGSEGGAVFDSSGVFIGLMAAAISRPDYQQLDLQFALPASTLRSVLSTSISGLSLLFSPKPSTTPLPFSSSSSSCSKLSTVALITLDSDRWGTAILLDTTRYQLVTSAHLIWEALGGATPYQSAGPSPSPILADPSSAAAVRRFQNQNHKLRVRFGDSSDRFEWADATLQFLSPNHIDIAVLCLAADPSPPIKALWNPLSLSPTPAPSLSPGDPVQVIGFGLFGPHSGLPATLTQGSIAAVVCDPSDVAHKPLLLQTSAVVHQGNSGGPLIHVPSGSFCGIVSCNSRQRDGTVLPRLNFALACPSLSALQAFVAHDGSDISDLCPYEQIRPDLEARLWDWNGILPQLSSNISSISSSISSILHSKL
ncbi:MAG: serine protease [archaeon]|nr:serine protease [archaeon]